MRYLSAFVHSLCLIIIEYVPCYVCCTVSSLILSLQFLAKSEKKFGFNVTGDSPKKSKSQSSDSVVNIVLVGGKNLDGKDSNGLSDPYVKFQLGKEKYKSKVRSDSIYWKYSGINILKTRQFMRALQSA